MNKQAFVALQKLRHGVMTARPDQVSVLSGFGGGGTLTVKQAAALVAWIDLAQVKLGKGDYVMGETSG